MQTPEAPSFAVLGGGTGTANILSELKTASDQITAIINMSDDGGSSGMLRDELGVMPGGDLRQCLVALSNNPQAQELFSYRFESGSLAGHSLGNLILAGAEFTTPRLVEATRFLGRVLNITGQVLPVTEDDHKLVMEDGGNIIIGEHLIGHRQFTDPRPPVWLSPSATITPEAEEAIHHSDVVVLSAGNLYGSLLPVFCVKGVPEALQSTNATKVIISNLLTKPGQTDGWHVADYVEEIERYIGGDVIDIVLHNNEEIDSSIMEDHAEDGEEPVLHQEDGFKRIRANSIGANLVSQVVEVPNGNDSLYRRQRTRIKHDAKLVVRELMKIASGRNMATTAS